MFQDKLDYFFDLLFPELSTVGSGTERECKILISNFLIAYLALYDKKYMVNSYECKVGELSLLGYDIKEITETLKCVDELSTILPSNEEGKYSNIIVKFVINSLYKGKYYREKQFIACFTNAYLYKIQYFSKQQLIVASGADIDMVNNFLIILSTLDSILNTNRPEDINNLSKKEILI